MDYLNINWYIFNMTTLEKIIVYLRGRLIYTDLDECELNTMKRILQYVESLREYEINQLKDAFFYPAPDTAFHDINQAFERYYNEKIKNK